MSLVITRFAPSPTGFLHIGGIRTALVNYLLTKKSKSQNKDSKFFIRIEDTDKQRSENKYLESIISGLNWLNIKWDGEIYKQSNNLKNHLEIANKLLNTNGAYKCICSSEKLDNLRKENLSKGLSIKRLCKTCENNKEIQSLDKNFCIRIKIRDDNYTEIKDEIQGNIKVSNNEIDNFVLVRNDGTPTYMLSVVVDDHLMGITHIIRGDDHLNNAFRQLHLYKNLNWKIPIFAHIPLMHGNDGKKLSKRHGSTDINEFKDNGYLPESIINYLIKLGIDSTDDEFVNVNSILENFKLESIVKSPSKFDFDKLNFINSHYLMNLDNDFLTNKLINDFNLKFNIEKKQLIINIIDIYKKRSKTIKELYNIILNYLSENNKQIKLTLNKESIEILRKFYNIILKEEDWSEDNIKLIINDFLKNNKIKFIDLGEPLRLILTGNSKGPSVYDIFYILGKTNTLKKINNFLI